MSRTDRKFARIYYDDLMAEFPAVFVDDAALATWVRLLILAERVWPTVPEIPRSVRIKTYQRLVEAGLVLPVPPHCYRIRGLDAERSRRQDIARNANAVRWESTKQSERSPNGHPDGVPSRDETRQEEVTPSPSRAGERKSRANGTNPRATGTNPRASGASPRQVREDQKRGPTRLHEILTSIQTKGHA